MRWPYAFRVMLICVWARRSPTTACGVVAKFLPLEHDSDLAIDATR